MADDTQQGGARATPLWRDANRLLLLVEEAVRHFPRYHKFAIGTDLRRQAMLICRLVARAFNDTGGRARQVEALVVAMVAAGRHRGGDNRALEAVIIAAWKPLLQK